MLDFESHFMKTWEFQVKGPVGDQIQDFRDKTSEKFEFVAHKSGVHKFCFTNKSPYHETIDFDVHVGHFSYFEQHAKDGNVSCHLFLLLLSTIKLFELHERTVIETFVIECRAFQPFVRANSEVGRSSLQYSVRTTLARSADRSPSNRYYMKFTFCLSKNLHFSVHKILSTYQLLLGQNFGIVSEALFLLFSTKKQYKCQQKS